MREVNTFASSYSTKLAEYKSKATSATFLQATLHKNIGSPRKQREPVSPSKKRVVPTEEWLRLRGETHAAQETGMPWRLRGPDIQPGEEAPEQWRGQRRRPDGTYRNSGGVNKRAHQAYFNAVRLGDLSKTLKDYITEFKSARAAESASASGHADQEPHP